MNTKFFLKTARLAPAILFLAFFSFLASCKKDIDATKTTDDSQNKSISQKFEDIHFGPFTKTIERKFPALAITKDNFVIQIHQKKIPNYNPYIAYQIGTFDDNYQINWNGPDVTFDSGENPSIALNDKVAVEMHYNPGGEGGIHSELSYRIADLSEDISNGIPFGFSQNLGAGVTPRISINNSNVIVEVHKSTTSNDLYYRVGIVNPNSGTVSWGKEMNYDKGTMPSIAINNNNQVIEIHETPFIGQLWYKIGQIIPDTKTILWKTHLGVYYQRGSQPNVALLDNGYVIELHRSEGGDNSLWSMVGEINGNGSHILWHRQAEKFGNGNNPDIFVKDKNFILGYGGEDYDGVSVSIGQIY
ncbi:MAG: hypothetical protein ACEPOV_13805 [Hyphomicrobiales bacterium]